MDTLQIIQTTTADKHLCAIAEKILNGKRISNEEGLLLYEQADLSYLGILANAIREKQFGNDTFFNKNFHIEPTNYCIYNCKFCSYKRNFNEPGGWEYSHEEMLEMVKRNKDKGVTEVHIVGGVHPKRDVHYYAQLIREIKKIMPTLFVKAFTAVELEFMIRKAKMPLKEGLQYLKEAGLDAIPGGGAEIFDETLRTEICDEKTTSDLWLTIHKAAHELGISSNATILYGHLESYAQRIDHMARLRNLQDETNGFNAYIPLKYKKANNSLSHIGEVPAVEDLRNFAVSRLFLDNIPHLKAYWPMLGRDLTQLSLSFGVDDIDGTIDDSTKIYSLAGAEDQNPSMTTEEIVTLIKNTHRQAVERNTVYGIINRFE